VKLEAWRKEIGLAHRSPTRVIIARPSEDSGASEAGVRLTGVG
jgi:hypothetical protein